MRSLLRLVYRYLIVVMCMIVILICIFQLLNSNLPQDNNKLNLINHHNLITLFDFQLLQNLTFLNSKNVLYNEELFLGLSNDNLVIVVQVHNRLNYLKNLITSLSKVKYINEALIIFSHDFYDENINKLIKEIKFSKVIQIFFPFSIQIWNNTFPGTSIDDCKKDLKQNYFNCTNVKHPDSYGHYRESYVSQTKHHWFWKLNYVFEHLYYTKNHKGDFVFVEEDHYISPDFIHTWKLMKRTKEEYQKRGTFLDILTLGNYDKDYDIKVGLDKFKLTEWFSAKHNMAFTIDHNLWFKLKQYTSEFCTYDDYNWDWTLMFVFSKCLQQRILTLVPVVPRVYHIGNCGIHHKDKNCDVQEKINSLVNIFDKYNFINENISVINQLNMRKVKLKNNGGWADPRDHQLCKQYRLLFKNILKSNANFAFKKLLNLKFYE